MNGFVFGVIILAVGTGVLGCLGVIAYFRIPENIRFLLDGHKIQHGRLTVAENTIRVQIDNYAAVEKRYIGVCDREYELQKCVQKLSSAVGQVKSAASQISTLQKRCVQLDKEHEHLAHDFQVGITGVTEDHFLLRAEFLALAKELGYEVKTVDSGPTPHVTKLSPPANVRAAK